MPEPLKNMFNQQFVDSLAQALQQVDKDFDAPRLKKAIFTAEWEARELKGRMRHITVALRALLPDDYRQALSILYEAAQSPHFDPYSYETIIFPDFVEVYGQDDWDASLPALEHFTQQSSAEFAVRPFIIQNPTRMMAQMSGWAEHENYHVRRLASEGCRPRLPWAMALPAFKSDPSPILPILEKLKSDSSAYVRRSVANNLNDIAKDNPQVVIDTLSRWKKDESAEMRWLINHALRTLVKAGRSDALAILGFASEPALDIGNFQIMPQAIRLGQAITFSLDLCSTHHEPQQLMVDYRLHFVKANGSSTPKVFKLARKTLHPGETLTIEKKHSFKPITTRRYYPGEHAVAIQINGQILAKQTFTLHID